MHVTFSRPAPVAGNLFAGAAWLTAAKLWCLANDRDLEGWTVDRQFTCSDNERHSVGWDADEGEWRID